MSWEPDISRALTNNALVRRVARQIKAWTGHPVLEHHKWHFLVLGVLVLVAVPWGLRAEEHALEDASVQALSEAGIVVADVSFNGRNAVVTAPESSTDAITATLGSLTGVRTITFVDGDAPELAAAGPSTSTPPTTTDQVVATTTTSSTTTTLPPPPEASLVIEVGDSVRISGTLPDALTVSTLSGIAEFMYGVLVENELLVDNDLPDPVWLESADDIMRTAAWFSKGSIGIRGDRARVVGTAPTSDLADAIITLLQTRLGADVPLDHDVTVVPDGTPATFEIVAGSDTIEVRGTLPSAYTIQRITSSVVAVSEEAEVTNEMVIGEGTPSNYVTLRTPYMVRVLGTASQFTYRYDDQQIRGSVVGGGFFVANKDRVTRSMEMLVDALAATMLADPDLMASLEIHSSSADGDSANAALSDRRARTILLALVRAGIDPERVTIEPGEGAGELLRFHLAATENK